MIILRGNWKCGWALDLHTTSSKFLGGGIMIMFVPKQVKYFMI